MKGEQHTATARLRSVNNAAMELDVSTPSRPTISQGCNQFTPKQVDLLSNNLGGALFCGAEAGKSPTCINISTRDASNVQGQTAKGLTKMVAD